MAGIAYYLKAPLCRRGRAGVCHRLHGVWDGSWEAHRDDWRWGFALKVAGSHGRQVGPSHCGPLHGAACAPADVALASLPTEVTRCHFHGMLLVAQAAPILGGRETPKGVDARRWG